MAAANSLAKTTKKPKRQPWPKIREVLHKNGTRAFMVDGRLYENGVRKGERFFYPTKGEADTKAEQLRISRRTNGREAASFPEKLRHEALDAVARLAAVGASITEAVDYFLKHARPTAGGISVENMIEVFLAAKAKSKRRPEYLRVQKIVLSKFANQFAGREMHTFTFQEIENWMNGQKWKPRTWENYRRDLANIFGFAEKRGYCAANPMKQAERVTLDDAMPCILTIEEVRTLLRAAQSHRNGYMVPFVAIGLFAGLRTSEIAQLDWTNINIEKRTIHVTPESAKGRARRIVSMSENLAQWLTAYSKESGPVTPQPQPGEKASAALVAEKRFGLLRKHAGFTKWGKNSLRHSFGSYHVSAHQNAPRTSLEMGHDNPQQLFDSYREIVTPEAAASYWQINP